MCSRSKVHGYLAQPKLFKGVSFVVPRLPRPEEDILPEFSMRCGSLQADIARMTGSETGYVVCNSCLWFQI